MGGSGASFFEKGDPDRQRFGGDLSIYPFYWFRIFGHGYYDRLYESLYDAGGSIIFYPLGDMEILGQYEFTMPAAFLGMGSIFSVFSYENISRINSMVAYTIKRRVSISGEYNHYIYDRADSANRFGGSIGLLWGKSRADTISFGLFDLDKEDNGYLELRAYFYQSIGKRIFCALDGVFYKLDKKLYEADRGYYSTGSFGWHVIKDMDLQISGIYISSPIYDEDFRALLKLSYQFDFRFGEGETVQ